MDVRVKFWVNVFRQQWGQLFSTTNAKPNILGRVVVNSGWLMADRVIRLGLGLIINIWLVRYLGTAQYGSYSYAAAFVAIFTPFAGFGLETIVVRELVRQPEKHDEILGTAFLLILVGGFLAVAGAASTIGFLRPHDDVSFWLVVIFSSALIFQAFDVIEMWYQSQVAVQGIIIATNVARLLSAFGKIILMELQAPLLYIAMAVTAEFVLVAIGNILIYVQNSFNLFRWRINPAIARQLLAASWPLAISLVASALYGRLSLLLLGYFANDETVGIYAAATRASEIFYTLPPAIMVSAFPLMLETRRVDLARYHQQLQILFGVLGVAAVLVALPATIFSRPITLILYGAAYTATAPVLAIHMWTVLFVFLGAVQAAWDAAEGLTSLALARTIVGSVVIVGLGVIWAPTYGAVGMAAATVLAYALSIFLVNALHPKARQVLKLQVQAPWAIWQMWGVMLQKIKTLPADSL